MHDAARENLNAKQKLSNYARGVAERASGLSKDVIDRLKTNWDSAGAISAGDISKRFQLMAGVGVSSAIIDGTLNAIQANGGTATAEIVQNQLLQAGASGGFGEGLSLAGGAAGFVGGAFAGAAAEFIFTRDVSGAGVVIGGIGGAAFGSGLLS